MGEGLFPVGKQAHGEDQLLGLGVCPFLQLLLNGCRAALAPVDQAEGAGEVEVAFRAPPHPLDKVGPLAPHKHFRCGDIPGVAQGQGNGPAVGEAHAEALLIPFQQFAQVHKAIVPLQRFGCGGQGEYAPLSQFLHLGVISLGGGDDKSNDVV